MAERELRTWSGELIGYVDDTHFDPHWPAVCFPLRIVQPVFAHYDEYPSWLESWKTVEMRPELWRNGEDDPYECWRLSKDDVPIEALRRMRWFREIPATVTQKGQVT